MKEQITQMYEKIEMPRALEQRILQKLTATRASGRPLRRFASAAAACALVLGLTLSLSPQVRAAAEEWVRKYVFPDTGLTIYEQEQALQVVLYDTEAPAFAQIREDRLYFTGNGENLDITDQISETEPFFYQYEENGLQVHMVVGMAGELENFGIYTFIQEPEGSWVTGTGRNFLDPETDAAYPWVALVWEELEISWPLPGQEDSEYEVTTRENPQGEVEQIGIAKHSGE